VTESQGIHIGKVIRHADVATLMFYHAPNMPEILAELTPFVSPQDMSAIQDIISDLEQRIARIRRDRV
jgi:hypothetical protein